MNLTSFYGGPNGQSFYIKKIFKTMYGVTRSDSMRNDIARGWTSPVSVGEFVMISYGYPGSQEYENNKNIDFDAQEKEDEKLEWDESKKNKKISYNATLWKKTYNEAKGNANGLAYELIASLAGNTPKIQVNDTIVLDPVQNPTVDINSENPDEPELTFSLPRAVKFWYGDKLGKRKDKIYIETNEEYVNFGVGDYYINIDTGFVYLIKRTKIDEIVGKCEFEFQACFQAPTPDVETQPISPYLKEGETFVINEPSVEKEFTNEEETQWKLKFNLPKTPETDAQASIVGPLQEAQASTKIYNEDTLLFDFKIPRGSRIVPGDSLDKVDVNQVKPGDYFLNALTGQLYLFNERNEWILQPGTLKGPAGDPLHIVSSHKLNIPEDYAENNLENGVNYLETLYGPDYQFTSDQLYGITWVETITGEGGATREELSYYWYYKGDDGKWARIQPMDGGGIASLENEYVSEVNGDVTDKAYSVHYINSLIKDEPKKDPMGSAQAPLRQTTLSTNLLIDLLSWGSYEDALGDAEPVPDILTVSKLEIISRPNKTTYEFGDTLDTTGIIIQATRQDNSIVELDSNTDYTFSPMVLDKMGIQPITVTYTLEDGTVVSTTFDVVVGDKTIAIPRWKEDLYYNGNQQNVDNIEYWDGYNTDYMTIDAALQINVADDYIATFTLKEGYLWSDGTSEPKDITWGIQQAIISGTPVQDGTIVENGSMQSPSWKNFNANQMDVEFTPAAAAGSYPAEFTAKTGYKWGDTDERTKIVYWEILSA